jgi:hypothetical protein
MGYALVDGPRFVTGNLERGRSLIGVASPSGRGTAHTRSWTPNWVAVALRALKKRSIVRAISGRRNRSAIFVLVAEDPEATVEPIPRGEFIIDRPTLERHFESIRSRLGHVPARIGSRFSRAAALKFARRLGRKHAEKIGISAVALSDAWYFSIWTEFCTLIPIRHVARRIAKLAGDELLLIPIDARDRRYLSFWAPNDIEPFFLAEALRKEGANVCFYLATRTACQAALTAGEFSIRFRASAAWDSQPPRPAERPPRSGILVPQGIRSIDKIRSRTGYPLIVGEENALWGGDWVGNLFRQGAAPHDVSLDFVRCLTPRALGEGLSLFKAELRCRDLGEQLFGTIGDATKAAAFEPKRVVEESGANEAHVCDHLFFQSALIAYAVGERGGAVTIWPHSSNAVHLDARQCQPPDRAICVTRSTAAQWRSRYPATDVRIESELLIKRPVAPQSFNPIEPIHVVIMAGANALLRMPIIDQTSHEESYRRLFARLESLGEGFRFVIKPKPIWETAEWLESLLPQLSRATTTSIPPSEIDLPNMIFLTVSLGSATILEGIGRGIPSMVVRETEAEDYINFDRSCVPVGTVDQIIENLRGCADRTILNELTVKQIEWLERELHFTD